MMLLRTWKFKETFYKSPAAALRTLVAFVLAAMKSAMSINSKQAMTEWASCLSSSYVLV